MTRAQVVSALASKGFTTGQWLTLDGSIGIILKGSDKSDIIQPRAVQFYFSPSSDYYLSRHTTGNAIETTSGGAVPDGYAKVFFRGSYYNLQVDAGGVVDASADAAGKYHTLTSFEAISGMFDIKER